MKQLAGLDSTLGQNALTTLQSMSPTAVLWTFELMRLGASRTLEQCLAIEFALARHAIRHPDFLEGVRAMVIDKDHRPRWSPASVEEASLDEIRTLFHQLASI